MAWVLTALLLVAALDDFRFGLQEVYTCGDRYLPLLGLLALLLAWALWRTHGSWRIPVALAALVLLLYWAAGWLGGSLAFYLEPICGAYPS